MVKNRTYGPPVTGGTKPTNYDSLHPSFPHSNELVK